MYSAANHQRDTLTQYLMKEFTPLGLQLLGPTSMAWVSVLAQCGKKFVYKALWLMILVPMCSGCPN